jgi:hypothetical protein
MPSEFYKDRFERKIPITGLFLERVGALSQEAERELDEQGVVDVIVQALQDTGLCDHPSDEDLEYVSYQLNQRLSKEHKEGGKAGARSGSSLFGYFAEWASSLEYDKLCFYVAGFDYAKAKELFEQLDQQVIEALANEKLRLEYQLATVSFESALFGFGGGYKDTLKEGDQVFDLDSENTSAEQVLKNLGF